MYRSSAADLFSLVQRLFRNGKQQNKVNKIALFVLILPCSLVHTTYVMILPPVFTWALFDEMFYNASYYGSYHKYKVVFVSPRLRTNILF